jgi:hypothetical protein
MEGLQIQQQLKRRKRHGSLLDISLFIRAQLMGIIKRLVPLIGLEPTTYRLQGDCSTIELKRHEKGKLAFMIIKGKIFFATLSKKM